MTQGMNWQPPPKMPRHFKILKVIAQTVGLILVMSLFVYSGKKSSYIVNPTMPIPDQGLVVGITVKDKIHYITREQREDLYWWGYVEIGALIACVALVGTMYLAYGKNAFRRDV